MKPARQPKGQLHRDVMRTLERFRRENGYKPGMTWNPYKGVYEPEESDDEPAR